MDYPTQISVTIRNPLSKICSQMLIPEILQLPWLVSWTDAISQVCGICTCPPPLLILLLHHLLWFSISSLCPQGTPWRLKNIISQRPTTVQEQNKCLPPRQQPIIAELLRFLKHCVSSIKNLSIVHGHFIFLNITTNTAVRCSTLPALKYCSLHVHLLQLSTRPGEWLCKLNTCR